MSPQIKDSVVVQQTFLFSPAAGLEVMRGLLQEADSAGSSGSGSAVPWQQTGGGPELQCPPSRPAASFIPTRVPLCVS